MEYKSESPTVETVETPEVPAKSAKPVKPKKERKKMTDVQKSQLTKHMNGLDMGISEKKSHRMKMMARMIKGDKLKKAHKDIMAI